MTVRACPATIVGAPIGDVWALLADTAGYDKWWDAQTERIVPSGPAASGQTVYAHTRALGRRWAVTTVVESLDASKHQIRLRTMLPFGISVSNHISCAPLAVGGCRVQFG
jgi:hypothetical protein